MGLRRFSHVKLPGVIIALRRSEQEIRIRKSTNDFFILFPVFSKSEKIIFSLAGELASLTAVFYLTGIYEKKVIKLYSALIYFKIFPSSIRML